MGKTVVFYSVFNSVFYSGMFYLCNFLRYNMIEDKAILSEAISKL
jgi:hypothetical protein